MDNKKIGSALNIDCDAIAYFMGKYNFDCSDLEAKAVEYFNQYLGKGLSDILYNINNAVPCDFDNFWGNKYLRTEENGVAVDYKDNKWAEIHHKIFTETGVDPFAVWIGLCRKNGINPWLSFRMNDVHYSDLPTDHSEFFYKAKKNGWMLGLDIPDRWKGVPHEEWYPQCLDYSVPEVREYYLKYINFGLDRYDVYGIELDWQRTIWNFKNDDAENCKYMNVFMEELHKIITKYEEKYGHKIKVMARINIDIDENILFGFDVREWSKHGWIDVVVPSPYWGNTDSNMPIAKWKKELEGTGVEVYPGFEGQTCHPVYVQTADSLAGYTAMYLSTGADKVYLYNLFHMPHLWNVCESLEAALAHTRRRYLVSPQNCAPMGVKPYIPLPIKLEADETKSLTLKHGILKAEDSTIIYVGVNNAENKPEVKYNGISLVCEGESLNSHIGDKKTYPVLAYRVPADAVKDSLSGDISFTADKNVTVCYVELMNGKEN